MTDLTSGAQPSTTHTFPDFDLTIDFLRKVRPTGPWVLTAIEKDGKKTKYIETQTFGPERWRTCQDWLRKHGGAKRNLYWSVNPTLDEISGKRKAERADIKELAFLHVDIDPRVGEDLAKEQQRINALFGEKLPEGIPPPTAVVFSGGGYQGFWRLQQPVPINGELDLAEEEKRYNQHLEYLFGGDNCHNVDRIMRLPGTINWKTTKGRQPTRAELVTWHDVAYPIEQFTKMPPLGGEKPKQAPPKAVEIKRIAEADELKQWEVSDDVKVLIVQGTDPEDKQRFPSRSECLFYVVCSLIRCKVPDGIILGIITDPQFSISESVLEQPNPEKYAQRQLERAREATREFALGKGGTPLPSPDNIRIALEKLDVAVAHDLFQDRSLIEGLEGEGPFLDDHAARRLRMLIGERFQFLPNKELFVDVVIDLARQNKVHPVREYLDSLRWDGQQRIDHWLHAYGGAQDNEFNSVVGAIWLQAAVRRIRLPGCKFDQLMVWEGEQGNNKSTALRILAVKDEWFYDDFPLGKDGKEVIEATQGKWIIEAAELHGMSTSNVEQLKGQLSRQVDSARLAYGRLPTDVPRQFIAAGTTNGSQYLSDPTGNRRFWPVPIKRFDLEALRRDRDQLWAEAAAREAQGLSLFLPERLWPKAAVEQRARVENHPFVDVFEAALAKFPTGKFPCADAWTILDLAPAQKTQANQTHIGASLRTLGYERKRSRVDGVPTWCYVKGNNPRLILVERCKDIGLSMNYEDTETLYVQEEAPF
jgi:hypothetical protein